MLILKVKKLVPEAILPSYAHCEDSGLDLHSSKSVTIEPGKVCLVPTGIAIELPSGFEGQIRPRSGMALKSSVTVLNSPGTLDEGYRGEIQVLLINHGDKPFVVSYGMRIAQLVIAPVFHVTVSESESLSDSERGKHGFGSSGI